MKERSSRPADPGEQTVAAFLSASRALVAVAARSLTLLEGQVSLPQWRLLVVLAAGGPMPLRQAAQALGTASSSLSRMADRLAAIGLVERRASPASRRSVLLALSGRGARLVARVDRQRAREIAAILTQLPPGHRRELVQALELFSELATPPPAGPVGLVTL